MIERKDPVLKALEHLKHSYLGELPGRLAYISEMWSELSDKWDLEQAYELLSYLHNLAGSGQTFGCGDLGTVAKEAESVLLECIKRNHMNTVSGHEIDCIIKTLKNCKPVIIHESGIYLPSLPALSQANKEIFILEDNKFLARTLSHSLLSYGYNLHTYNTVEGFQSAVSAKLPDAVIVDIQFCKNQDMDIHRIRELKQVAADLTVPALVLGNNSDFSLKLAAKRAGADAFQTKPVEIDILVSDLDRLTAGGHASEELRVLFIDHDQEFANHNALLIEKAGMKGKVVTKPGKVGDAIGEFNPDLIVMELFLPECNGRELADIIRFYPHYLHIPVVFLSTEPQIMLQLSQLKMAGDDFLIKPLTDTELLNAVRFRAMRSRQISEMMSLDHLTGLLKHTAIKDRLKFEMSRAVRSGIHFSLVMLDLDYFRAINESYGHVVGDRVIRSLGRLLRQRVRTGDAVARYGGEEFAIILYDCILFNAEAVMEKLLLDFSQQYFSDRGASFNVTFSCGICYSADVKNPEELLEAAEGALRLAKTSGRNQVQVYRKSTIGATPSPKRI